MLQEQRLKINKDMMNKIFSFFRKKKELVFTSGAIIDDRTDEEKAKDYKFEELVTSATPVDWKEKAQSEWRRFPIFNQDGSGSCVAQTMAKMMGILYWLKNDLYVHFSATHIYQRRVNKPQAGMAGVDAFTVAQKSATLEELVPSQNMNDSQMDAVEIDKYKDDVGKIFKIGNYITLPTKDIESVASVIQVTKKPVMVWFFFEGNEWNKPLPTINNDVDIYAPTTNRHSVTAIDFTLYKGKKALIIEDSWGPQYGMNGQRIITEDFFKKRNFFAAYTMNFDFDDWAEVQKPKHTFNVDLEFGQTNDEIKVLQDVLKYEGLFPLNTDSTGYYGAITKKSVEEFQLRYSVADATTPGFGRVGPKTRRKLNELYS